MAGLLPDVDPDGLLEYSVVYTDRALNHMSDSFQAVMKDISRTLKDVYAADAAVVIPGSGTFAMEAVARQFANDQRCLVIRNGWFSYRWSQIFQMGSIPSEEFVLKARPIADGPQQPFQPPPIDEVVQAIRQDKPALVFAAHVETASGILLPEDYIKRVAQAAHEVGALFVLDAIASGTIWVNMRDLGIDILVSAPQKGWTGSACCGLVMLGSRALERLEQTQSTSFACDLRKWLQIMQAYEQGGHAYHATLPTDSLKVLRQAMAEAEAFGFNALREAQWQLGQRVRSLLKDNGFKSVAAAGFEAPGVVVCYTDDDEIHSTKKFAQAGIQAAAGVPLQCDEPAGFKTFRLGLFGIDKLRNIDRSVDNLAQALKKITKQ